MIPEGKSRTSMNTCISLLSERKWGKPVRPASSWENFRPTASQIRIKIVTAQLTCWGKFPLHVSGTHNTLSAYIVAASQLNWLGFITESSPCFPTVNADCVWHATTCQLLVCMRCALCGPISWHDHIIEKHVWSPEFSSSEFSQQV
jgi:hypothetical protein